ncbi:MAG: response regulator, partial [Pseudobdellovibrionaceae bacterium]
MVNNNLPIKTLIVDDSVVIRKVLERLFKGDSRFRVVGEAGSCKEALRMIKSMELDLITMDLHMPDGTGLDVIKSYMNLKPVSTVVISSLRPEESNLVLESLENGAIDYIEKPDQKTLLTKKAEILDRLFHASQSKKAIRVSSVKRKALLKWPANSILLIGASTG